MTLLLLFNAVCLVSVTWAGDIESFPYSEKRDLNSNGHRCYATVAIENPRLSVKESLSVTYRFYNTSGNGFYYNPFFESLFPLPAQLAVYDTNKKFVCDLLEFKMGSRCLPSASVWTHIPNKCYVGKDFSLGIQELPPGEYYLQMIFIVAFVSSNPQHQENSSAQSVEFWVKAFMRSLDRRELFRSNIVKFTVTE
ncbi:MAG: hypothetical protein M0Q93_11035 [Terrimicrobiaceae bacterium]|nr:hypothetical protein [Terrimicrobiaceae bacterium]